ncbi:hemoglobin subunit alpha-like [Chiloscyllium plagiosum]|uniref:hemoglobin subunit alpha-like n=1 Tax=Chiloscyllium plagiosum TaxID=36176 RepID=UPI001CB7F0D8|nr:hemoglobin subunit alpha-like [Chiloscyllium plagiosum]
MALETITEAEKAIIEDIGKFLEKDPATFGAESLARLFIIHPGSKAYFSYDENNQEKLQNHGKKVIEAVANAANNVNNLKCNLDKLATKHGKELLVDPQNFPVGIFAGILRCSAQGLDIHLEGREMKSQLCSELSFQSRHGEAVHIVRIRGMRSHLPCFLWFHVDGMLFPDRFSNVYFFRFQVFSTCIQVSLANHVNNFTPSVQLAVDKFLKAVNEYLSSKYR